MILSLECPKASDRSTPACLPWLWSCLSRFEPIAGCRVTGRVSDRMDRIRILAVTRYDVSADRIASRIGSQRATRRNENAVRSNILTVLDHGVVLVTLGNDSPRLGRGSCWRCAEIRRMLSIGTLFADQVQILSERRQRREKNRSEKKATEMHGDPPASHYSARGYGQSWIYKFSKMPAAPMPPPTHIVTIP
jgi:hypothetical protein